MKADIFISYKSEEEEYAQRIKKVLEDNGISCWMAPDSIPAGSNYMAEIPHAIEDCRAMIILISKKSQQSAWVKNEFSEAMTKQKRIIPYVIQDCELEDDFAFSMSTMQQVYAWKNEKQALEKVVRDLKEMLGEDDSAKIEITVSHRPKIPYKLLIGAAALTLIFLVFFILSRPKNPPAVSDSETAVAKTEDASEVYYSEIIPYAMTGYYTTVEETQEGLFRMPQYGKAFSILSFIRNRTESSVFVEKIQCDILDLRPDISPVMKADGFLEDDTVSLLAFNNGWGDAEQVQAEWTLTPSEDVPVFEELTESVSGTETFSLASGGARKVFQKKLDFSRLLDWCRQGNRSDYGSLYTLTLKTTCEGSESTLAMYLMYDSDHDRISAFYGGWGEESPSVTLYAVLDVDQNPSSLRFTSEDAFPVVDDVMRIETVIAPTKSCELTCRGVYSVDGTIFETDPYDIKVFVPYFADEAVQTGGSLTRALAEIDMNDSVKVSKLCEQYRYSAGKLIESAKNSSAAG